MMVQITSLSLSSCLHFTKLHVISLTISSK